MLRALSQLRRDRSLGSTFRAGGLLLLAYVASSAGLLAYSRLAVDPGIWADLCPIPWLAEGIGVSALLLGGIRLWPAVLLGSCVVWGGFAHDPPISVGIDACGEAISLVLIVHLLKLWGFNRRFDRLRDSFVLLGAALIGRLVAGNIDVAAALIAAWLEPAAMSQQFLALVTMPGVPTPVVRVEFLWTIARWELNSVAGIVLVVPAMVASRRPLKRALAQRPASVFWFAALAALWCAATALVPYGWASWPLLLLALLLVSWAAIDFGVVTASLCTLALCCSAAASFCLRVGPLARTDIDGGLAVVWGFIALLCCAGPVLATTLAVRRRDLRRLTSLAERNLHIFMGNPCPAWVIDTQSGKILQANDEATRQYGYSHAEFQSMLAKDLLADGGSTEQPIPSNVDLIAAPFVKHRTCDGRIIDVDVESSPLELTGRAVTLMYAVEMTDRQHLRRRLLAVADRERRRLAQELHDGLGQILTGLALGTQSLLMTAQRGVALAKSDIAFASDTTASAELLLAHMTEGISPLEALGGDLVQALLHLPQTLPPAERARLQVVVEEHAPLRLALERREHLYRIAQEAVANSLKHARATELTIRLQVHSDDVRVLIEDNGVGVEDRRCRREGLGLRSMKLRAQAMAGEVFVATREGGGTVVTCTCPQAETTALAVRTSRPDPARRISAPDPAASRSTLARDFWNGALIAAACCTGAALTMWLAASQDPRIGMTGARLAIPSLMSGAAAAGLIVGGRRLWWGPTLGVITAFVVFQHAPVGFAVIGAFIVTSCNIVLVTGIDRLGFRRDLSRWQDPIVLVGVAAITVAINEVVGISALVLYERAWPGAFGPALARLLAGPGGIAAWTPKLVLATLRWWADGLAGIVLTVPAVVAMPSLWTTRRDRLVEGALWVAAVAGWAAVLLGIPDSRTLMPLLAVAILILIWAASRFGVALASIGTLLFAMTGATGFALQRGALAMLEPQQSVFYVWGFIGVLTTTGLFIAALLAERDRSRESIRVAGEWYKRLFEADPRALWVHEAATGRIVAVNDQALRTFGQPRERCMAMRIEWLFGAEAARDLLAAGAAPARSPVEIRYRTGAREFVDLEVSSLPSVVDGRSVYICFAQDVTERNLLRRANVERTDIERRRLASELRVALAGRIATLRATARQLERAIERGDAVVPILETMVELVRNAAAVCRQSAHRASPLQASDGDFVVAMRNLYKYVPAAEAPRVRLSANLEAPIALPDEQAEHLYELVREAVLQCAAQEPHAEIGVEVSATPHSVQVAVRTPSRSTKPPTLGHIGRESAIRLRAMAMGARLWAQASADGAIRLVCECLNASAA